MASMDLFASSVRTPEVEAALSGMAETNEVGRGAIFTRPEIVEAILDLSGYCIERPLHEMRLLEPSFGAGEFLLKAVDRLLLAFERAGGTPTQAPVALKLAIRAVELHENSFCETRSCVLARLKRWGMREADAQALCEAWLLRDDFLLASFAQDFDFVVGNPPYVRQERIPQALLREYRQRFSTLYDRADLYVVFFERSLDLLAPGGTLGFICANRWLKNRYGGPLREKISGGFWVKYFLDTEGVSAFLANVIAYPAITVIQKPVEVRSPVQWTRLVHADALEERSLANVVAALLAENDELPWVQQVKLTGSGSAPLLLDDVKRLDLVQEIEARFPTLEQARCKVGIGVATGCDGVYIGQMDELPVEPECKLPLVMARDLVDGSIQWSGNGVINPFDDAGGLVDLGGHPRLRTYLEQHGSAIRNRNVARRNPDRWFRTIDRIYPRLAGMPKLLVPDIKGEGVFVFDDGRFYPHHNLYYILSERWDLRALQAVLRSSVTLMTVAAYCTRMAGGFLRFQAQYLRRIRVPAWEKVPLGMRERLIEASASRIQEEIDAPAFEMYGIAEREAARIRAVANAARRTLGSQS